jgi:hypothetical protein
VDVAPLVSYLGLYAYKSKDNKPAGSELLASCSTSYSRLILSRLIGWPQEINSSNKKAHRIGREGGKVIFSNCLCL